MMKIHSLKKYKPIRRTLRKNMTKSEVIFWSKIKSKQLGYKFRRQHSIGKYIVDFYCPELQLVIELDGRTHEHQVILENDQKKQEYLEELGFAVERYADYEIFHNLDGVVNGLWYKCQTLDGITPP